MKKAFLFSALVHTLMALLLRVTNFEVEQKEIEKTSPPVQVEIIQLMPTKGRPNSQIKNTDRELGKKKYSIDSLQTFLPKPDFSAEGFSKRSKAGPKGMRTDDLYEEWGAGGETLSE